MCDVLTVMMNVIFLNHFFIHYSKEHNHCT